MLCLDCHYDLKNLTEHRCPECGRAFDPGDPNTFQDDRRPSLPLKELIFLTGVSILFLTLFLMTRERFERALWGVWGALSVSGLAFAVHQTWRSRIRA